MNVDLLVRTILLVEYKIKKYNMLIEIKTLEINFAV